MPAQLKSLPETAPSRHTFGRVHSVYRSTVNFTLEGELFCLQSCGIECSPVSFSLEEGTELPKTAPNETVEWDGARLRLGSAVFTADGARRFRSRMLPCMGNFEPSSGLARYFLEESKFFCGGFADAVLARGIPYSPQEREAFQIAKKTAAAVAGGNLPAAADAACEMLGLGYGLTPSGDDWLCGILALLCFVAGGNADCGNFKSLLVQRLLPRLGETNDISGRYLELACAGDFCEPVLLVFSALDSGDTSMLHRAIRRTLNMGHSSGADLLSGVAFLMMAMAQK